MTERKNVKVDKETYERLREQKGEYETWNLVLNRLLDMAEECEDQ
jgi:predicted CopG family antitoxin